MSFPTLPFSALIKSDTDTYDPNGEATAVSQNDDAEYKCLLRATDGHVKFETLVSRA